METLGRSKLNKKIYKKEFWKNDKTLRPEDILGAINILVKVNLGFNYF